MPVRVIEYKNGQYKLQSKHGRLSGRYQGGQLNPVDQSTADIFGGSIRPAPEKKGGKEVTISFAKAVALENKRGSITSAQKAGRIAKSKAPKAPKAPKASKAKASGLKQGKKRRRSAEDEVDETGGSGELVQAAKRQRRGRGPASIPQPIQTMKLRQRG